MKYILLILILSYGVIANCQDYNSKSDFDRLRGIKYSSYSDIGYPKGFISGFIDSNLDFGISGLQYKKAVIFTLELFVGRDGDEAIHEIKDYIIAPKKCYYEATNCYKLVNQTDTIGSEYIVFKSKKHFSSDRIISIYKANRNTGKFELMNLDCFRNCLIYNEMTKFNIRISKKRSRVWYFE